MKRSNAIQTATQISAGVVNAMGQNAQGKAISTGAQSDAMKAAAKTTKAAATAQFVAGGANIVNYASLKGKARQIHSAIEGLRKQDRECPPTAEPVGKCAPSEKANRARAINELSELQGRIKDESTTSLTQGISNIVGGVASSKLAKQMKSAADTMQSAENNYDFCLIPANMLTPQCRDELDKGGQKQPPDGFSNLDLSGKDLVQSGISSGDDGLGGGNAPGAGGPPGLGKPFDPDATDNEFAGIGPPPGEYQPGAGGGTPGSMPGLGAGATAPDAGGADTAEAKAEYAGLGGEGGGFVAGGKGGGGIGALGGGAGAAGGEDLAALMAKLQQEKEAEGGSDILAFGGPGAGGADRGLASSLLDKDANLFQRASSVYSAKAREGSISLKSAKTQGESRKK